MDTLLRPTRLFSPAREALASAVGLAESAAIAQQLCADANACRPAIRLLVVDDEPLARESAALALRAAGYRVDFASDGEEGWDALQRTNYDLLITDNAMPRLTGIELLQRIRAARQDLAAILVSGAVPWDTGDAPREFHPLAVLEKPYRGEDLLLLVRAMVATKAVRVSDHAEPDGRGDSSDRTASLTDPGAGRGSLSFPASGDGLAGVH
ncbi:MAG TPA: response regulator [Opitutaceae bacterium]|nr:response regulator [Opitutaceae bacterium]